MAFVDQRAFVDEFNNRVRVTVRDMAGVPQTVQGPGNLMRPRGASPVDEHVCTGMVKLPEGSHDGARLRLKIRVGIPGHGAYFKEVRTATNPAKILAAFKQAGFQNNLPPTARPGPVTGLIERANLVWNRLVA